MILCPLCQRAVRDEEDKHTLQDDELNDFFCPTRIIINEKEYWSHYSRQNFYGQFAEYIAVIPPYKICWWDGMCKLKVQVIKGFVPLSIDTNVIYESENIDKQDFHKICERFSKLKVFA